MDVAIDGITVENDSLYPLLKCSKMQCVASNSISCMRASVVLGYSRLEGRGYRHDRGTCVVSGPTQFDNFRKCF